MALVARRGAGGWWCARGICCWHGCRCVWLACGVTGVMVMLVMLVVVVFNFPCIPVRGGHARRALLLHGAVLPWWRCCVCVCGCERLLIERSTCGLMPTQRVTCVPPPLLASTVWWVGLDAVPPAARCVSCVRCVPCLSSCLCCLLFVLCTVRVVGGLCGLGRDIAIVPAAQLVLLWQS